MHQIHTEILHFYSATALKCYNGTVKGKKHCEMLHNPPALSAVMTTIFVRHSRPKTIFIWTKLEICYRKQTPILFINVWILFHKSKKIFEQCSASLLEFQLFHSAVPVPKKGGILLSSFGGTWREVWRPHKMILFYRPTSDQARAVFVWWSI